MIADCNCRLSSTFWSNSFFSLLILSLASSSSSSRVLTYFFSIVFAANLLSRSLQGTRFDGTIFRWLAVRSLGDWIFSSFLGVAWFSALSAGISPEFGRGKGAVIFLLFPAGDFAGLGQIIWILGASMASPMSFQIADTAWEIISAILSRSKTYWKSQ